MGRNVYLCFRILKATLMTRYYIVAKVEGIDYIFAHKRPPSVINQLHCVVLMVQNHPQKVNIFPAKSRLC